MHFISDLSISFQGGKIVLHSNAFINISELWRFNSGFLIDYLDTFCCISHNVRILVSLKVKLINSWPNLKRESFGEGKKVFIRSVVLNDIFWVMKPIGIINSLSKLSMLLLSCYTIILLSWQHKEQSYFGLISINQTLNFFKFINNWHTIC